jgi:phosphatidate cytidylyltransferase
MRHGQSDYAGFFLFLLMCFMIWGNDSLAYYGGRMFGKHLMAPHMSPKKTWEGFAAGFLGAGLAFVVAFLLTDLHPSFAAPFTWQQAWPMILLASVFGPIGDLAESKVKRAAGAKDSSTLLPGHGGFWDRFDSMLLVAPAMYLYILLLALF